MNMRNHFGFLKLLMALLTLLSGITSSNSLLAQTPATAVATVNGRSITQKEVDDSIALRLLPLQQQIYALRKAAVGNLIIHAILEETAKKKGISVEELKRQMTAGTIVVTSAQIDQTFADNASVFGAMSPDEVRERLRLDLESQARMKLYSDSLAGLRKNFQIEVSLAEPEVVSDIGSAPFIGPKDAPITIVEYADFQCPFCRQSQATLKQVLQSYGEDVKLVFKQLPLEMHAEAFSAAQASFCAGRQNSFWPYLDRLFTSQTLSDEALRKSAATVGLDQAKFSACISSDESRAAVLKDMEEARRLGINSTPTYVINGTIFRGTPSLEQFASLIKQKKAAASSPISSMSK
jgi:protein-disulfide isomerase